MNTTSTPSSDCTRTWRASSATPTPSLTSPACGSAPRAAAPGESVMHGSALPAWTNAQPHAALCDVASCALRHRDVLSATSQVPHVIDISRLLLEENVKPVEAFHTIAKSCALLCRYVTACNPKTCRWQDELDEAAQFCEMLVTGGAEDAADPAKRRVRFPALQPGRLAAALARYREADANSFSVGSHPRMPRVGCLPYGICCPPVCRSFQSKR